MGASDSSRCSEIWSYLLIPLLISFSEDFPSAKAQSPILSSPVTGTEPWCAALEPNLNLQPVMGILSHPGDGASGRLNNASDASYIAASYVKLVEAAGARVVPLIYNEPIEILYSKLSLVNGMIFTGGRVKSGLYYEVVDAIFKAVPYITKSKRVSDIERLLTLEKLKMGVCESYRIPGVTEFAAQGRPILVLFFNKILERNDAGEHFPLFAVCLGFELITMIISKDENILQEFNASHQASTLQFMENTSIEGTVFQRFPPDLLGKLSTDYLLMQNHRYGISPERLQGNVNLCNFFRILTTSTDRDHKVYVSTMQAHNYPVTAVQWHPEKNAFEWGYSMIPHSEDAIRVTQHVANFLVSEARKSLNRPPTQELLDNLIYNYSPTYCGKAGRGFDEVYTFSGPRSRIPPKLGNL